MQKEKDTIIINNVKTITVVNQRQFISIEDAFLGGNDVPLGIDNELSKAKITNRILDNQIFAPHGCLIEIKQLCERMPDKYKYEIRQDAIPVSPSTFTEELPELKEKRLQLL